MAAKKTKKKPAPTLSKAPKSIDPVILIAAYIVEAEGLRPAMEELEKRRAQVQHEIAQVNGQFQDLQSRIRGLGVSVGWAKPEEINVAIETNDLGIGDAITAARKDAS